MTANYTFQWLIRLDAEGIGQNAFDTLPVILILAQSRIIWIIGSSLRDSRMRRGTPVFGVERALQ